MTKHEDILEGDKRIERNLVNGSLVVCLAAVLAANFWIQYTSTLSSPQPHDEDALVKPDDQESPATPQRPK